VVDGEKRLFLFSVESYSSGNQIFRLMDLSASEGKVLIERRIEGPYAWIYANNTIFLNNVVDHSVKAMNLKFEDYDHPLVHFIEQNKNKFQGLRLVAAHPTLPFAIIQENVGEEASVVTWNRENHNVNLYKIFNNRSKGATGGHQFSNDGKWVYFREYVIGTDSMDFILMPVDPKLSHYLGKPILLGEVPDYPPNVTAMTRNPAGLVVADRTHYGGDFLLKKWDFTQAIPLIEKEK
jgi:hypothetical protein